MRESIQLTLKQKQEGNCRRSIGDTSLLMSQKKKSSQFMYSLYIFKAPEWKCWKSWSHLVFNSLWLLFDLQWSLCFCCVKVGRTDEGDCTDFILWGDIYESDSKNACYFQPSHLYWWFKSSPETLEPQKRLINLPLSLLEPPGAIDYRYYRSDDS